MLIVFIISVANQATGLAMFSLVGAAGLVIFAFMKHNAAQVAVEEIDKSKPGFGKFYTQWRGSEKSANRAYWAGEILGIIGGGVAGAVSETSKQVGNAISERAPGATNEDVIAAVRDLEKKL